MTESRALCLGITGTDTGVGKTVVTSALAARARQMGLRVAAMKPLETGVDPATVSDAERLQQATGGGDALSLVRPYALREPLAPMVAAQRAGLTIDLATLQAARDALAADRDLLLVEGAGGLLVPISADYTFLDLFAHWQCALVIVAANRLGVLNHVLLTVRAAESADVAVRAIVLLSPPPDASNLATTTNGDALATLLPQYSVVHFPWLVDPTDLDALATAARESGLGLLMSDALPVATAPDLPFSD